MAFRSSVALLLVCLFAIMAFIDLGIIIYSIFSLCTTTNRAENVAKFASQSIQKETLVNIGTASKFLFPPSTSALDLARLLSSSLNETKPSMFTIETKVAPRLFLAFKTLRLSQIVYIGSSGSIYSYYTEGNQTFVLYSNTSEMSIKDIHNVSLAFDCYTQKVDNDVGKLSDKRIKSLISIESSWLQKLNTTNNYASLGRGWGMTQEHMFFSTVAMDGLGVVSLGFSVKAFKDAISRIDLHGGDLYLVTKDGTVIVQTGPHNVNVKLNNDTVSILVANSSARQMMIDISCEHNDEPLRKENVGIGGKEYMLYCMPLDVVGIPSVSILVHPQKGLMGVVKNHTRTTLVSLILLFVSLVITFIYFIFVTITLARRDMFLCAALIKQMEATQQAERRITNKSSAVAKASHDIRSSLAAIDGIVSLCITEVAPNSEIHMNLAQMRNSTAGLLDLLNNVLDTSKIEAGEMQLTEKEFYLGQVLEESVNLYYPVGKNKGIDLVLDPCDGSVDKHPVVRGDSGKLKQILTNLLHNAIKFTSNGHIVVRAWVKKPSPQNLDVASKSTKVWKLMWQFIFKNNETYNDLNSLQATQPKQNLVEFIIEVDDTGKGIPKEKQKSIFQDFVQVKETAGEQGGTGLGLGIVQSMVRLMGGDIGIINKDLGEKGTCFRFNIFLSACEAAFITSTAEGDKTSLLPYQIPMEVNQITELNTQNHGLRTEGSHIVLFIPRGERRRILQKFLHVTGVKVSTVDQLEHLFSTLERIKHKSIFTHLSSSGKSDLDSLSDSFATSDMRRSVKNGVDYSLPFHRKASPIGTSRFILVVVDFSATHFDDDQFSQLHSSIESFKKDSGGPRCKVVWLYTPNANVEARRLEEKKLAKCQLIMSKPLHGSRFYQLLKLLPEFGGANTIQGYKPNFTQPFHDSDPSADPRNPKPRRHHNTQNVVQKGSALSYGKLLDGKKVLVAEDNLVLRKVAIHLLGLHGANVECCENGEEAVERVCNALRENGQRFARPLYDFIFMDCQMPIMDGYEATRKIRLEEKLYNIRLPIIALTANAETDEQSKTILAGMDAVITKPLNDEKLFEAIHSI